MRNLIDKGIEKVIKKVIEGVIEGVNEFNKYLGCLSQDYQEA